MSTSEQIPTNPITLDDLVDSVGKALGDAIIEQHLALAMYRQSKKVSSDESSPFMHTYEVMIGPAVKHKERMEAIAECLAEVIATKKVSTEASRHREYAAFLSDRR